MFKYKNLILILTLTAVITFLSFNSIRAEIPFNSPESSLISASTLNEILKDKEKKLKIIDLRSGPKYLLGHIPGAVHMNQSDFSDRNGWVKGLMAEPQQFTKIAREKGIDNDSNLILYAENNSPLPTRLWWIFKVYGHQSVRILNRGYQSWAAADYEKELLPKKNKVGEFKIKSVNNSWLINSDTIAENLNNENFLILDLRPAKEYRGEKDSPEAARRGRIPGSLNFDWSELLKDDYTLKDTAEITKILENLGLKKDKNIVVLSNTGISASHTFFVLKLLDYKKVKLYDESWLGWSHRSDLPVEIN